MKIGIVTDLAQVNSWYRALPLLELQRRGHLIHLDRSAGNVQSADLRELDVVHVYRFHGQKVRKLVEELRDAGVAIVWDNDDDLTMGPEGISNSKARGALRSQRFQAEMIRMLRLAHVVTTPSPWLVEQYRGWGAEEVRVVENYLTNAFDPGEARPRDGVTIGWTACEEHYYDMRHFELRGMLLSLLETHPQLRVASVGIDLGLPQDRYQRFPLVQYPQLASHVAQYDIGIAPIVDIPFNHARSNVKVKEYAAAGVPWLASPIGPYAGLGEKQGGRLVPDDRWHAELDALIRSPRARRKLAKRGLKWARSQTAAENAAAWEAALSAAVVRARGERPPAAAVGA